MIKKWRSWSSSFSFSEKNVFTSLKKREYIYIYTYIHTYIYIYKFGANKNWSIDWCSWANNVWQTPPPLRPGFGWAWLLRQNKDHEWQKKKIIEIINDGVNVCHEVFYGKEHSVTSPGHYWSYKNVVSIQWPSCFDYNKGKGTPK